MTAPVLSVADLTVRIGRGEIVHGVSFDVAREQTLGIVGESGSGKSMTVLAATGLLDAPGAVVGGTSTLTGESGSAPTQLVGASDRVLRRVHGARIGFVFQDPGTSLNPLLTLGRQITESLEAHRKTTRREATSRALELLEAVGLPDAQDRLDAYPHQLSGGQRQRVMIAIALACDPELLIADEPTTALDVTTQAQIIDLVRDLQRDFGTAVVWISHDLGVIGQVADDVTVLQDGNAVEQAPVLDIFDHPQQSYTRQLLDSRPLIGVTGPDPVPDAVPLLVVDHLNVTFDKVHAVQDVSFEIRHGTTLGLVGESGSGKSTVAAALTGLVKPDSGTAVLAGTDVSDKSMRRRISLVLQDPFSSLNPRMRIGSAIAEPLRGQRDRVPELLELVGLPTEFASRYPHELSGGQRQRVSIARALAVDPELLILDESTASLDVSVQARVLDLLTDLQRDLGLTYLFIAHDLAVVQRMCHDVLVMRAGKTVEYGPAERLFADPGQEYTRELLAAIPPAQPKARI